MSGGAAYVLDLDVAKVNTEMVELGPVPPETVEELRALLQRHAEETGSVVAEELLDGWDTAVARFTEVMPLDYRRVLRARAAAEEAGLDEDETTEAMMEAAIRA
jgi:glutamate synthase (NADPH/NADH) large chain